MEDCLYLNIWVPQGKKDGRFAPPTLCRRPPSSQRPRPCPLCLGGLQSRISLKSAQGAGGMGGAGIWGHWACSALP